MGNIKKFEDFLDKMRGLLDNAKKQGHIIVRVEDIENTFPELKESEDEKIRKEIISYLHNEKKVKRYISDIEFDKWIAWLEKQAEQKSAWSEEDEQIILSIEQAMNCASLLNVVPEKIDKIKTWLKSLKDRCTWKPSSLQMECLHDAINHYHTNGYPASKLNELYEQMSKIYKL